MASNDVVCIGQRSACVIRATRLDNTCKPVHGVNNAVVTAALITATATPDVEAGQKFEPKNACGELLFTAEDPDIIKRYQYTMELGLWDFELYELLTGSTVIVGASDGPWPGKAIGNATPGPQTPAIDGVALEIWVKTAIGQGPCGPTGTHPPYVRHIFPRLRLRPDARTFANDVANAAFAGEATANEAWDDPFADYQGEGALDVTTPYAWFYDDTLPDVGCGYIDVPAS